MYICISVGCQLDLCEKESEVTKTQFMLNEICFGRGEKETFESHVISKCY